ncbi:MAG: hypothetical protein B5M53_07475 [Candidatus Cloacimonas sp. 4484_209]|nr:MAG: hypothetical protein B5M53_07475 [Candidatus Cloacimonas sp. 4484_209]
MRLRCDRCGKEIPPGGNSYIIKITAISNFDGIIEPQSNKDLKTLLKEIKEEIKGLPEELIEEEVYKEREFILCPRCKEIFLANPFGKKLDDLQPPNSIPPP